MEALARLLSRKPVAWGVVAVVVLLSAVSGAFAWRVDQDDDLLAFLPQDNPEVAQFFKIDEQFGALNVGIVGIAVDDPLSAKFLTRLRQLTKDLNDRPEIQLALSLANVDDFAPDEAGGIRADYLVNKVPENRQEKDELRRRVMSRDQVVGNLISKSGKAVNIYCFLGYQTSTREAAGLVRQLVREAFPYHPVYWGGAPFISTYIYDLTQSDMQRLIPWAVAVILLIALWSFRDAIGAVLALGSTGLGIVIAYGVMGLWGINANIVLGSMPVILFAVGSAYGIHILVRYYGLRHDPAAGKDADDEADTWSLARDDADCAKAIHRTLVEIGPTVLAAGLTTVAGLLSFTMMDIAPMRTFGLFTALGILTTLVLALTFIPAVIRLTRLKARTFKESFWSRFTVGLIVAAQRWRRPLRATLALLALFGLLFTGSVDARMENAAFFNKDSPPDRAQAFFREQFGGSEFIQVWVEGDLGDPNVLREVQHLADRIALFDHVSSVTHVGQVIALVNEAWTGERRIPPLRKQLKELYTFLKGREAVRQLLVEQSNPDGTSMQTHGLLQIKIDTDDYEVVAPLLAQVEQLVSQQAGTSYRVARADQDGAAVKTRLAEAVYDRIIAHLHSFGVRPRNADRETIRAQLEHSSAEGFLRQAVQANLIKFLRSDESILEEDEHDAIIEPVAERVAALGPEPPPAKLTAAVTAAIASVHLRGQRAKAAPADGGADGGADAGAAPRADGGVDAGAASRADGGGDAGEPAATPADGGSLDGSPPAPQPADDAEPDAEPDDLMDPEFAADLAKSLLTPVNEIWRQQQSSTSAAQLLDALLVGLPRGDKQARLLKGVADAMLDLRSPTAMVTASGSEATGTLKLAVSGSPVLYRGLSKSVTVNQWSSLIFALGLVLVIMIVLLRSLYSGLLAVVPTAITLLLIYGLMGLSGVHLDIGTSMLGSIIIGAGVDYAVHLLAAWRAEPHEPLAEAARRAGLHSGPAIWTNALMVAAGFFVLTLGDAKPLQNVGGLTSAAMITAALATFIALPVLAAKRAYGWRAQPAEKKP